MKRQRVAILPVLAALLSLGTYVGLAYATPRPQFGLLLGWYGLAFTLYAVLLWRPLPLRYGLLLALVARLLWLPALPALSDDYFRFRWDGNLVAAGHNPYQYRPVDLVPPSSADKNAPWTAATQQLYERLNSPAYYSIYPPVCQAAFGLASWLFPRSELGFVVVLRLLLLAAEAATATLLLALLRQFGLSKQRALLYLLNPLVIVELTGNLHFEALTICGLLAAIWLLTRHRVGWSAGVLAAAIATKLLPALLLPLLLRRLPLRQLLRYGALTTIGLLVLFAPFLSAAVLYNLSRSLDLYFHKFEFNASLYYLLRAVGYWYTGYNQIARLGTLLAVASIGWTVAVVVREKRPDWPSLPQVLLFTLSGYYALATTVHPWYLTTLVALSVFTRYRYALVWSALIPLSYATYQTTAYTESLSLVALEYTVVAGVLLRELLRPAPVLSAEA